MNKVLPYNLEAEQAVLGSIFIDNRLQVVLFDKLQKEDFFDIKHQHIFQAMINLFQEAERIDYTMVINMLTKLRALTNAGGMEYVVALSDSVPSSANFESYIKVVSDLSLKRKVIFKANDIIEKGYDSEFDTADFIDYAERNIFEVVRQRNSSELLPIEKVSGELLRITENSIKNKGRLTGLNTGFMSINSVFWGFQKQELMILAARPGGGKSALAVNFAVNVAKLNKINNRDACVAVFSLEMGAEQLVSRMVAGLMEIDGRKIKSGNLETNEIKRLTSGLHSLSSLNIYFDDAPGVSIGDIRAKCRKLSQDRGLDFVIIDYLQLIVPEKSKTANRQEEVARISRGLKLMARELNVPVLALAQLSRSVEQRLTDTTPKLSDLRESGSIEQDADIVMFLHNGPKSEETQNESDQPIKLIIAKNRSGSTGEIDFRFIKNYSLFKEIKNA